MSEPQAAEQLPQQEQLNRCKYTVLIFGIICGFCVSVDIVTKEVIFERIGTNHEKEVIDGLVKFSPVKNPGVVFGFMQSHRSSGEVFLYVTLLAVPVLLIVFVRTWRKCTFISSIAFAFIISGAIGNLTDRFVMSDMAVRDFIYVYKIKFPVFNLADSFIVMGTIILAIDGTFIDLLNRGVAVKKRGLTTFVKKEEPTGQSNG